MPRNISDTEELDEASLSTQTLETEADAWVP